MIKLKYRIKTVVVPFAQEVHIPQYKIIGLWLSIKENGTGNLFSVSSSAHCDTFEEAEDRIRKHVQGMERANNWAISEKVYTEIDIEKFTTKYSFKNQ